MSRELDAAIAVAHEVTKEKVVKEAPKKAPKKPASKPKAVVPEKAGAPAVKVDKSGHRVRLRNIDHALEGCISTENGDTRYRLEPNVWTTVPEAVYIQLRDKFYKPQEFEVPDWNGDLNNPRRMVRKDAYQEYIIEFPEERE